MKKLLVLAMGVLLGVPLAPMLAADDDDTPAKEKLQALNDFIGNWKGTGGLDQTRPDPKENECRVSGGLGTIPVSFNGVTYFVCCNGCKDAFNENPEKYVKEFLKKKAAGGN